jgi:uncharacterized protein YlxW (UPF0749 family)
MAIFRSGASGTIRRDIGHALSGRAASIGASLTGVRRRVVLPLGTTVLLSGVLLLGGLAAGVLLSAQWQARAATTLSTASGPVTRQSDREIVAATISRLESEQARLKSQIADLRSQLNSVQGTDVQRKSTLSDINNEIARQRIASGTVAVRGTGVTITLDDSTARSIPENEDPANYILHEYDLRDVLNTLWTAGAEAASVNGERIVSNTSLYCVGTTIIANATRLSPPYEIHAIGDPQALSEALRGSSQMAKLNQRAQIYDLPIAVQESVDVFIPAYNGSFVFRYATVQGQ